MRRSLTAATLALALASHPAGATRTAWVANALANSVTVLDARTAATIATVQVGCEPRDVAALPDGTRLYVANMCSDDPDSLVDTVSVIDAATRTVVDTIDVGTAPRALAVSPDGARLYVANYGIKQFLDPSMPGTVSVIDTATDEVVATLALGFAPFDVAVAVDGDTLYVTGPAGVALVDPGTAAILDTIPGPRSSIAVDPSGRTLHVTDAWDGTLSRVDLVARTVTSTVPIGVAPQMIAIDPHGARVWVTSAGASPNQPPDEVTIVRARSETVARRADGGDAPVGVALASRRRLLVSNFYTGDVLVLDAASGRRRGAGHAGPGAGAIAVTP